MPKSNIRKLNDTQLVILSSASHWSAPRLRRRWTARWRRSAENAAVLDIVDDRVEREAVNDSTGTRWRGFRTRKVRRLEIAGVEGQRLQVVRHALVLKREPDAPSIGRAGCAVGRDRRGVRCRSGGRGNRPAAARRYRRR